MVSPFLNEVTKQKVNLLKSSDLSRLHDIVELQNLEIEVPLVISFLTSQFGGTDPHVYNFKEHMTFEMLTDPK
jgi:hypothetical protein